MHIKVTGRQIDIGEALRSHAETEIEAMAGKYAGRPTDAQVIFAREGHEHDCEIVIHLSTGLTARAGAAAAGIYPAFDRCLDRMDKQLRRHKRRLKDHQKTRAHPVETSPGASYVIESSDGEETDQLQPVIVAETETRVPRLSVGEAVMQMELDAAPLLVFRNEKTGGVNVVHRRDDGHVGWIDP